MVLEEKPGKAKHRYAHMLINCRLHGCAQISLETKTLKHFHFPQQMMKQKGRDGWFALSAHVRWREVMIRPENPEDILSKPFLFSILSMHFIDWIKWLDFNLNIEWDWYVFFVFIVCTMQCFYKGIWKSLMVYLSMYNAPVCVCIIYMCVVATSKTNSSCVSEMQCGGPRGPAACRACCTAPPNPSETF